MQALLMHPDRDFDVHAVTSLPADLLHDLTQDLDLEVIFDAMAAGDGFLRDVARSALLTACANDLDTIRQRQAALRDCLDHPDLLRQLYTLVLDSQQGQPGQWLGIFSRYPGGILLDAVHMLEFLSGRLHTLRRFADQHAAGFRSPAFTRLFAMLQHELTDDYLAHIRNHLAALKSPRGVLFNVRLGVDSAAAGLVLRRPPAGGWSWWRRLWRSTPPEYTFRLAPRDDAGARTLTDLRSRGINSVANALAQSAEQIMGFFHLLRTELAFYAAALNLHQVLEERHVPSCFPAPAPAGSRRLHFDGLHDLALVLTLPTPVVPNTLRADGKAALIITGANQGGKSSFLRSLGIAQLLMQAGLFVPAQSLATELCTQLFTHYRREEDAAMEHGRLDEELVRLSVLADRLTPKAFVLFSESFASTNEREGSEIARQVTQALLDKQVRLGFVTHLFEFSHRLQAAGSPHILFLRAKPNSDGTRTYRITPGAPEQTSHAQDLLQQLVQWESPDRNRLVPGTTSQ